MPQGSLVIVGTGIKCISHITAEARTTITQAEKVFFLLNEPVCAAWLQRLQPAAESLAPFYIEGQRRIDIYRAISAHILRAVRQGQQVCAVFYGHPGVFVTPAQEALRQARRAGFPATMLPGISAEDCLFADLGIDPGRHGCQSFDATDFLVHRRRFDPTSQLILWQVGVTGNLHYAHANDHCGLRLLAETLALHYGAAHQGVIYEAAQYPTFSPRIDRVVLDELASAALTELSTLYVPPRVAAAWDTAAMARLQIDWTDILVEGTSDE